MIAASITDPSIDRLITPTLSEIVSPITMRISGHEREIIVATEFSNII
jgi:hypothetical protein